MNKLIRANKSIQAIGAQARLRLMSALAQTEYS
jgi:hypothetical protein